MFYPRRHTKKHFVKRLVNIEISLEDVDKGIEEKKNCLTINNQETTDGYIFLSEVWEIIFIYL